MKAGDYKQDELAVELIQDGGKILDGFPVTAVCPGNIKTDDGAGEGDQVKTFLFCFIAPFF